MKKTLILLTPLIVLSCKNDDEAPDPGNYQTPLPEATQTGKGTFACYVDGKAYIAKKNAINAYNQYYQGRYGISIRGKWDESEYISRIGLESNSAEEVREGITYQLGKIPPALSGIDYYAGSVFFENINQSGVWSNTNEIQKGELKITKHALFDRILSATFWFDIKQPDGKIIEIRDGRFDIVYN